MKTKKTIQYVAIAGVAALGICQSSHAGLIHRYSFTSDTSDSVGGASGTLVGSNNGGPTISGGQLQLNNTYGTASSSANYLSLSPSILPSSGSATIEEWFTFNGSGFFTEAFAFGTAAPGQTSGQYLMGVISAPQPSNPPGGSGTGGSHISQTLNGWGGGETDAYETTAGIGASGGGYLDNGDTYMMSVVIDGNAGTLSYYLYDQTQGGAGGLQQSITAIPLSSYSFTQAFLGRSDFDGDNATLGAVDEFRIYNNAQSSSEILADYNAGPNALAVPEPASMALMALGGGMGLLFWRRRRVK